MQFSPDMQIIAEKLDTGERLSAADGLTLYTTPHLLEVGVLAQRARERRHGRLVTYIVNRHLNPTNICVARCPLCAFSRSVGEPGAYCLSVAEVWDAAEAYREHRPAEFHIVGGLHPDLPFSYALELLAGLHQRFPEVALKAFTAAEIDHWARVAGVSIAACLTALQQVGLSGLTGGGAEIFAPRVRALICPQKISSERWLSIHETAHRLGIPTTATMLYGHVETLEERVEHLLALRAQQDRSGGFLAFIPLAYHPAHTQLGGRDTTGQDDLRTIAVARLLLDNIPHIKAYWVMLGVKIAQLAIAFGANDLDGTVMEERICHMAGGDTPQALSEGDLRRLIMEGGGDPVRRDSHHRPVAVTGSQLPYAPSQSNDAEPLGISGGLARPAQPPCEGDAGGRG
jgi:aminodeoxyfutalosine synthase